MSAEQEAIFDAIIDHLTHIHSGMSGDRACGWYRAMTDIGWGQTQGRMPGADEIAAGYNACLTEAERYGVRVD